MRIILEQRFDKRVRHMNDRLLGMTCRIGRCTYPLTLSIIQKLTRPQDRIWLNMEDLQ
jgi:hypothetical protein